MQQPDRPQRLPVADSMVLDAVQSRSLSRELANSFLSVYIDIHLCEAVYPIHLCGLAIVLVKTCRKALHG